MYFKRIKELREDNDVKQITIANYLKLKQQNYSRYEKGDITFPIQLLIKLADYYNTTIDYLVERTDKK